MARNRVRGASNATSAAASSYDINGRRVRARRRPPPAPLFQLATIGLEDHNYGNILAHQTVLWQTAKGTTSVKFSPSSKYILVGYGVRTGGTGRSGQFDVVVSMYRAFVNQIVQVQRVQSTCDDLNVALFHPQIGGGFVFGTKRGNIRRIGIDRRLGSKRRRGLDEGQDDDEMKTGGDLLDLEDVDDVEDVDDAAGTYMFCLGS